MKLYLYASPLLAVALRAAAREPPTLPLSTEGSFNFDLLVTLGIAGSGGSEVGPILGVAKDIEAGNMTSMIYEFYKLADDTKAMAEDPANAYDGINVRDTWFSASAYYRKADAYTHVYGDWDNPLIDSLWVEQTAAFDKAIAALPIPGERFDIPSPEGNFTVEAIWYAGSTDPNKKLPTVLITNGFDAAQEDSYHYFVAPALARGWNAITFDGPGQPGPRRHQNKGFILEWEQVVTPVVDYLLSEKASVVDETKVPLVGNSFGGFLAARAAAFEPRLSAAVLIGGVWDSYEAQLGQFEPEIQALFESGDTQAFDDELLSQRANGNLSTGTAWFLDQGLWAFNMKSPSEWMEFGKSFKMEGIVDRIKMPVFVGDAEFENFFTGQPQILANALGDNATLHIFNGTAGYHCQSGANQELSRTIFAWLHKTLW